MQLSVHARNHVNRFRNLLPWLFVGTRTCIMGFKFWRSDSILGHFWLYCHCACTAIYVLPVKILTSAFNSLSPISSYGAIFFTSEGRFQLVLSLDNRKIRLISISVLYRAILSNGPGGAPSLRGPPNSLCVIFWYVNDSVWTERGRGWTSPTLWPNCAIPYFLCNVHDSSVPSLHEFWQLKPHFTIWYVWPLLEPNCAVHCWIRLYKGLRRQPLPHGAHQPGLPRALKHVKTALGLYDLVAKKVC